MDAIESIQDMKRFIVETLDLESVKPEEIGDDQILFGQGLGLDSIDAFEIGVALRKKLRIQFDGNDPETRNSFRSPATLFQLVQSCRKEP